LTETFKLEAACTDKLYSLVTEAYVCEQLAEGSYLKAERPGVTLSILS